MGNLQLSFLLTSVGCYQSSRLDGRTDEKSPVHHCVVDHFRLVGQISVKLDCQQLNDMLKSVFAVGSADGLILKPYLC